MLHVDGMNTEEQVFLFECRYEIQTLEQSCSNRNY